MSKNGRASKFNYKRMKKRTIPLYSRNDVNEKEGNKNRKVGLEPRLLCAKETVHDMLNMAMNESYLVWPLK